MKRLIPYPLLFAGLLVMWLVLNGFTPGQFLLGLLVAFIATHATVALEPDKVTIHSWGAVVRLFFAVTVDIVQSNLAVLRLTILDRPARRAGFVVIPLELRDRTGLAVLALIINCAPGTAWLEYDSGSGAVLIHVLDHTSDAEMVAFVKSRYEKPLKEIFG